MKSMQELIITHPFFAEMEHDCSEMFCSCAGNVRFAEGEVVFKEGEKADDFYLLRAGRVGLESFVPGRGAIVFQTLEAGDIFGTSSLVPPYVWSFDARALEPSRVFRFDAACLRGKCEENPAMGYVLMKALVPKLVRRLQGARFQGLNLYADKEAQ